MLAGFFEAWIGLCILTAEHRHCGEKAVFDWIDQLVLALIPFARQGFEDQDKQIQLQSTELVNVTRFAKTTFLSRTA